MPVYVDNAKKPMGRMIMCHMVASSLDELHAMALHLELKPIWFQNKKIPHYDICLKNRTRAINAGAIPVRSVDIVLMFQAGKIERNCK